MTVDLYIEGTLHPDLRGKKKMWDSLPTLVCRLLVCFGAKEIPDTLVVNIAHASPAPEQTLSSVTEAECGIFKK